MTGFRAQTKMRVDNTGNKLTKLHTWKSQICFFNCYRVFIIIVTRSSFFLYINKKGRIFLNASLSFSFFFFFFFKMFETEESSVASSFGDQDDMDHFLDRCSICFDAQLDMCLEFCRDQYCVECFQR